MSTPALTLVHEAVPPPGPGPHPLLLLLHGRGANEQDLLPLADGLDSRFLVVGARAPLARWGGYHWYDLIEMGTPEPATFAQSLLALQHFVGELLAAYPVAANQLYLLGFSQGAMMAGSMLMTQPETIAGAVLLSGYLPLNQDLPVQTKHLAGMPIFIGHGVADNVLTIRHGREARDYFQAAGADLSYHEYPMAHQISTRERQDVADWLTARLEGTRERP
ncbi:MAG TPA: phospholipase [Chloroflexota bacterium]|jgi:phospholipase/carboxylesterase|nr:phospholipase [Chloroflexota bacterium]